MDIKDILTVSEAAQEWGLVGTGNIRQACLDNRFTDAEARKSGATWLITRQGMLRVFGEPRRKGDWV